MKNKKINVVELFAGVGGFRVGLERNKGKFQVVWSNQWEPSTKIQHASMLYEARFGKDNHSNRDITSVNIGDIPDHDLLVGGFPCQDYSVASTLKNSKGLIGKKGVLWWSIHKILSEKKQKPKYLLFENVDRLLKSPVKQRGKDFAIMLKTLDDLGYAVEWRVINAAEYGMPQRRRRIFFIGYHKSTKIYKEIEESKKVDWINESSIITKAFPIQFDKESYTKIPIKGSLVKISESFNLGGKDSLFSNTGVFISGKAYTIKTSPFYNGKYSKLKDILEKGSVKEDFLIPIDSMAKWDYLKGPKKEERITKEGFSYNYSEGGMIFPDNLDYPSRTIITGEGGKSPSRFKHVVKSPQGLRRLTPIELERLNMFPDNHTQLEGITDTKRAFFMGNALVVGIVEKLGRELYNKISD